MSGPPGALRLRGIVEGSHCGVLRRRVSRCRYRRFFQDGAYLPFCIRAGQ